MKKQIMLATILGMALIATPAVANDKVLTDGFGAVGYYQDGAVATELDMRGFVFDPDINTVVVTQEMRDEVVAKGYDCYPTPCKWLTISEIQEKYNKPSSEGYGG